MENVKYRTVLTPDGELGSIIDVRAFRDNVNNKWTTFIDVFHDGNSKTFNLEQVRLLPKTNPLKSAILEGILQDIVLTYKRLQPKGKSIVLIGAYIHEYIHYSIHKETLIPRTKFIYDSELGDTEFRFLTEVGENNAS
jgi:hypothetical protein